MKFKNIQDKLELYYNKLKNPSLIIDNWCIVDIPARNKLKKLKISNINSIVEYPEERLMLLETKEQYVAIKYSINFIATKVVNNEYSCSIQDWDLIAVDKDHIYKGIAREPISNKQILSLIGLKLSRKLIKDLEYFD